MDLMDLTDLTSVVPNFGIDIELFISSILTRIGGLKYYDNKEEL